MLNTQVGIIETVLDHLGVTRGAAQQLLDPEFKAQVTASLDATYRLLYDGKTKLLRQMDAPCSAG